MGYIIKAKVLLISIFLNLKIFLSNKLYFVSDYKFIKNQLFFFDFIIYHNFKYYIVSDFVVFFQKFSSIVYHKLSKILFFYIYFIYKLYY